MGFIEGKRIQASKSLRTGCKDFVIREETRDKTFLLFVLPETASEIMVVCEDLLMNTYIRGKKWELVEEGRTISMEVISNWRGNSLAISSITKTKKEWKRRIYIPEGRFGEGWLSLSRQIKELLCQERVSEISKEPKISLPVVTPEQKQAHMPIDSMESAWLGIPAQYQGPNRFGSWVFTVVCRVLINLVDWSKIRHRIAELIDGDFEFLPFDNKNAIIKNKSPKERDLLCDQILEDYDEFSLIPWHPRINGIESMGFSVGGWIGLIGLPFHLWNHAMFSDIGKLFGGLVSFDESDLSMLKIKVGGDYRGY